MSRWRRHHLLWPSEAPQADRPDDQARASAWQAQGRPFVITRRRDDSDALGLGFCTTDPRHPELRPRRVAARLAADRVVRTAPPPTLAEVAVCPAARRHAEAFGRLDEAARDAGLTLRVYGSWMWQALTSEPHVHDASDLDLLVEVVDGAAAIAAADLLAAQETDLGLRIDGELSFAGRGEVNWREFRQATAEVLLKSVDGLRLVARAELAT
ncbi:MAG: malonate decarboxylase holo-[acyl-carrier-protein] synthase [Reyranellaceae bacterium]